MEGLEIGSQEIVLRPGKAVVKQDKFTSDQKGSGYAYAQNKGEADSRSATLVFQAALPVLLFTHKESQLELRGGTDVSKCPPADYTNHILLPFLKTHFGINCELVVTKRGFCSAGAGEMSVKTTPLERKLNCISLRERGEIISFTAVIWTALHEYGTVSHNPS